jgi:hypothetical protein
MRAEMERVFDRPTPYTLNAVYGSYASKRRLEAHLLLKDNRRQRCRPRRGQQGHRGGGLPAARDRGRRPAAQAGRGGAARAGLLPAGLFLVPGREAPLDAYGNVPHGFIIRMLSDLQAWRRTASAPTARRAAHRQPAEQLFLRRAGSRAASARTRISSPASTGTCPARCVVAVFHFTRQPSYGARFDFYGTAQKLIAAELPRQFPAQWQRALATDRGARAA